MEDNTKALAAETELKRYGQFADKYVESLQQILEKVNPNIVTLDKNGQWCSWECDQAVVVPQLANCEYGAGLASLCGVGHTSTGIVSSAMDNKLLSKGNNFISYIQKSENS